jgi:acyl carrier protein
MSDIQAEIFVATLLKSFQSAIFPTAEVEACIRGALTSQAAEQALLRPIRAQPTTPSRSWEPEIDSLVAVEVICAVEELVGVELPGTFSPKGGYASVDACVNDLIAEAKAVWAEATKEKKTHEQ